ncbi:hypothetical protein [Pedobacter sp. FW305-3-2-15-E-R2A2]|uniref:AbiJ-NTD4 domain-containing protein n=1 Tax=Pedobacter sp. FW305-3-2-15-E-R2A2 TaxID=3140251 RepID=UPI003140B92E
MTQKKTFSQRFGYKSVRSEIQKESADEPLRNYLWNALQIYYFENLQNYTRDNTEEIKFLFTGIWVWHYQDRIDEIPDRSSAFVSKIKKDILNADFNEMFDLLEFIPEHYKEEEYNGGYDNETNRSFYEFANDGLKEFLSAYRFVDGVLMEITSEQEIAAIEEAMDITTSVTVVHDHLRRALELLTDRKAPDYRNSIKESISSVESIAKLISSNSKDSLAGALDKIKGKIKLHRALEQGFKSIYGYTSDEAGIRHALTDDSVCDFEDAKFMLVACSGFVNYLLVKAQKAEISLEL